MDETKLTKINVKTTGDAEQKDRRAVVWPQTCDKSEMGFVLLKFRKSEKH